jgi:hypothetical protein
MHISRETQQQTETRLRLVLSSAYLIWHEGSFSFFEFPGDKFPSHAIDGALALVRDAEVWNVLKPSSPDCVENFAIFSFTSLKIWTTVDL